ncbi:MAG: hypothetical protein A2360_00680 [Candidatus Staskawiczbacteria bacterium RIFOXYB1_FULL_32_11]|uniref:tRNA threonylcarbamoyladenosine biosynthesis protein TsaE n=1 Tax=Candidatus Staskawiczbacteria bacterium RIFOXYD1_FULL_32_13 TaxID=1802234 RepID=A0A1G2JPP8_9BACT|nr:MAG: hypothetical protein A2360_00680 [Candidatus Staskawiczbacteria bacterium RIFOXYB1_FULL_32_11]OGZ88260.1 MAG: hypothetical protein A2561_04875 [Candidatus Staskawiczbacteria bacterium RIFOXYD1_FULL_32_13]
MWWRTNFKTANLNLILKLIIVNYFMKYITKSFKQTQKLGQQLAKEILGCNEILKSNGKNKSSQMMRSCHLRRLNNATVVCLYGDLGSGKTTFLQGFAKGLGIKQKVLSPTFVIMKKFSVLLLRGPVVTSQMLAGTAIQSECTNSRLPRSPFGLARNDNTFKNFYHLDCYRLQNYKDAQELGLPAILKNPENIIAIEWPERIKKILFTSPTRLASRSKREPSGKGGPKIIKIKFKFINKNQRSIDILV